MSEFRKPEPTDKMDDHAEQHSHAFDEISNLKDYVNPLVEKVETNEDRINSLEAELEAVAETKSAGEWRLVSTVAQAGDMSLSDNNLTNANNALTLHQTDLNNVSHGFSGVEVGDLVEVLEEHEVMSRSTGDYGLYKVTGVNGQTFTLELQQGRGIADLNKRFYVKFFYLSEEIDIAELDARYAKKDHSHDPVPAPPGRPFRFGSATKKGEFFVNSNGAYLNREDLNGLVRTMPTGPDFTWATGRGVTIWDSSGVLKWAGEGGQSTDWNGDTLPFGSGKQLYNKGLTTGVTYYVSVEGYW